MAIGGQFAGLNMTQLIGGPLSAAADASTHLANSTADFIQKVGFDRNGKVQTVAFGFQKRSMNDDGTSNLDEMKVEVPMLAIVPIPNLQIDEVNILFDMEVKESEKSESSTDLSATVSGSAKIAFIKINVSGSVSSHSSNTRSTDNSAKYHVDVRATNHGTPEGLARVLDMMAANVAPALVGSTIKDGNGQSLSDKAQEKAKRLKALRQEISQLENRLSAAQGGLDNSLEQLRKAAQTQLNLFLSEQVKQDDKFGQDLEKAKKGVEEAKDDATKKSAEQKLAEAEKKQNEYDDKMAQIRQTWTEFPGQAGGYIKIIADSGETPTGVSTVFALKSMDDKGELAEYGKNKNLDSQYDSMKAVQNSAVDNQKKVNALEKELFNKKAEYSDAASGTGAK